MLEVKRTIKLATRCPVYPFTVGGKLVPKGNACFCLRPAENIPVSSRVEEFGLIKPDSIHQKLYLTDPTFDPNDKYPECVLWKLPLFDFDTYGNYIDMSRYHLDTDTKADFPFWGKGYCTEKGNVVQLLKEKTMQQPNAIDSYNTDPNTAIFYQAFMREWDSGVIPRNFENFSRYVRNAAGVENVYVNDSCVIENEKETVDRVMTYLRARGITILFSSKNYIQALRIENNLPTIYMEILVLGYTISLAAEGTQEAIDTFYTPLNSMFVGEGMEVKTVLSESQSGFETRSDYIFKSSSDLAKDHFYPWLKDAGLTVEGLIEEYLSSKSSVLLQIGPPGTGKSTLARTILLAATNYQRYQCADENIVVSKRFPGWVNGLGNNSLLVVEDADRAMIPRENENSQMSGILSATNGIISRNLKLIVTTNLPSLNKVDPALVRPGRCHRVLVYRELSAHEAHEIREIEGLPPVKLDEGKTYSLAEVLNYREDAVVQPKHASGFGFVK